jgi:hypothetical protein
MIGPKIISLSCILSVPVFLMVGICPQYAFSFSPPTQVSGKLLAGPFEFIPPEGYWYFSAAFPGSNKVLQKGERFQLDFYKTRGDMPPGGAYTSPDFRANVIFGFSAAFNEFKDINSYYDAVSKMYQAHGITDISFKDLPEKTKALFRDIPSWHCRGSSAMGYSPLNRIDCVMLDDNLIKMYVFGFDEKKVLDAAPQLKKMMSSFRVLRNNTGKSK